MISREPERRTLADGREAIVGLVDGSGWWGAVSAGRRDLALMVSTVSCDGSREDSVAAAMRDLDAGVAPNWTPHGERESELWREAVIALVMRKCTAVKEFTETSTRSTIRTVLSRRDPHITLAPLDAIVGFDAVERFYDRWPFLQRTFDRFMTANRRDADRGMASDDAFRLDADGARAVTAGIAAAMAADRVDDVAESILRLIDLFPKAFDIGDVRSATRLLACWNGHRTTTTSTSALLALAHAAPPDWLPETWSEANWFAGIADRVAHLVTISKGALETRTLISSAKGRWVEFGNRARQRWEWGEPAYEDVYDAFMKQVMWPAMHHVVADPGDGRTADQGSWRTTPASFKDACAKDAVEAAGWRLLFGGKSLPAMTEAVHDWHREMDAMDDAIGRPEIAWETPFDRITIDGFVFEAIGKARRLREEGRALKHCVGGRRYVARCRTRKSVIVSVGRILGDAVEPVSTAELTGWTPDTPWSPRIRQHRGLANERPAEAAAAALDKAIAVLAGRAPGPSVAVPLRAVAGDEVAADAGYDWMNAENVENAIRQWSHFLPREVAKGGLDWFRDSFESILGSGVDIGLRPAGVRLACSERDR